MMELREYCNALISASKRDFMTQKTDGALELIENRAASMANKYHEYNRSMNVNIVDTKWTDDLTA